MRILILSQFWHPENGIPQRRWTWLARVMRESGHTIEVIAPPPHYNREVKIRDWMRNKGGSQAPEIGPSGERIYRSPFLPTGNALSLRIIGQAVIAFGASYKTLKFRSDLGGVELVIGTVPALPTAVISGLVARILGVPYVIDLRDAWPDLLQESTKWNSFSGKQSGYEKLVSSGPINLLLKVIEKILTRTLERSSGIIVTSELLREELIQRLETSGHNEVSIITIRNVFPTPSKFKKRVFPVEVQDCSLRVLYAGTIGRAQDLRNAVDAAVLARGFGTEIKFRFVGAGAAKDSLKEYVAECGIEASFEYRKDASSLDDVYEWADTALVHLTDWEPLRRAVPSKTYELMNIGLHISGVVSGETKNIIEHMSAGHVVEPNKPEELARLWVELANKRDLLRVGKRGRNWVDQVRNVDSPQSLMSFLERIAGNR